MTGSRWIRAAIVAVAFVGVSAAPARAQGTEIGTSLASVIVSLGTGSSVTFGLPSGGFGLINPGLYAAFFTGPHVAIEPQIGLIAVSGGGSSAHVLNIAGQVDYFVRGGKVTSPFVFGSIGAISATGAGVTPMSVSAGAGVRAVLGERLSMRFDGRYVHYTDGGGNALAFTVSLGGLFGGK